MQRMCILMGLALIGASGCVTNHQPYLSRALIMPHELTPGDTALITVDVSDRFNLVTSVKGIVLEDKTISFHFHDDGTDGDAVAGDKTWSMKVDVPFNAPPGGFIFEISAYDANENLIIVRDMNGEAVGMQTKITLEISYPNVDAEPIVEEAPE